MKTINKILFVLITSCFLFSCVDLLDTLPEGGTLTEDQKKKAVEANPQLLAADIAAMNANMIARGGILGSDYHNDFGFAAACLYMDSNGADMTCANTDYNWFAPNADYTDRVYTSTRTKFMWSLFYKQIASANLVIASIDPETEEPTLKAYLGQALAVRAFDYLHLAQLHQFTYKGNESKLCVPIVTDKTTMDEASNNPRATVSAVYALIMDDLNAAVDLLEGFSRSDKGYIDQGVAYGLRARANLLMQNWTAAASDAKNALDVSKATPYTLKDLEKPLFWNAGDKPVMWANIITDNNPIVTSGIVNMPSHLNSFYLDGYTGVGAWKKINKPLFDKISSTDIRKGWWLGEDMSSPLVADKRYADWLATASSDSDFGPYANVKFGPDNDDLVNLSCANDWFLMRAEEMILIQAEGMAMGGDLAGGKSVLENFVKTYRDPSFASAAGTALALQDEIWFQRRVELWGEGFSFYDVMRLEKSVTRVEGGATSFPDAWQFNIQPKDPILLWLVPKSEIEANDGISDDDNNQAAAPPKA